MFSMGHRSRGKREIFLKKENKSKLALGGPKLINLLLLHMPTDLPRQFSWLQYKASTMGTQTNIINQYSKKGQGN